jgi:FkbM family methyltransferase
MDKIEDYIRLPHPIQKELFSLFDQAEDLVIFDIGCCEAEDSVRYTILFENARVFAFEPLVANFELAKSNCQKFNKSEQISLFNLALSNAIGEADFYVSSGKPDMYKDVDYDFGNKSSSLLAPHKVSEYHKWLTFNTTQKVKTDTLYHFCKERKIGIIDFIHIDVQGAEMLVLDGAAQILFHTRAIWIEVETVEFYKNQPLKTDIEKYLGKFGFEAIKVMVEGVAGDILFVNKKYFETKHQQLAEINPNSSIKEKLLYKVNPKNHYQKKSYAQNGEDLIISRCLEVLKIVNPTYLDIGANHPFHFNNTMLFYDKGGVGINIEPNKMLFDLFSKYRKQDINLNIGISDFEGELDYFEFDTHTLNTCSDDDAAAYVKLGYEIRNKYKIPVRTITQIISEHHHGVFPDVLSLDIEGLDERIIKSIDLSFSYPKIICVETVKFDKQFNSNNKSVLIVNYLIENGYQVFADTFVNTILFKK